MAVIEVTASQARLIRKSKRSKCFFTPVKDEQLEIAKKRFNAKPYYLQDGGVGIGLKS